MVSLLELVQEDDLVRPAPHGLRQLTTLVVPDVPWGSSDQPGDAVLLHVLGHVNAADRVLIVEQELRQGLAQLSLPNTSGSKEHESSQGPVVLVQPRTGQPNGVCDGSDGMVLANDALLQLSLHVDQLLLLAHHQLVHRNPSGLGNHHGDVLRSDGLPDHGQPVALGALVHVVRLCALRLPLQVGDYGVLQPRGLLEVAGLHRQFELPTCFLQMAGRLLKGGEVLLLLLPLLLKLAELRLLRGELVLQRDQPLLRGVVLFLVQGFPLDLQSDDVVFQLLHGLWLALLLQPQLGGGLVHQVNGFVRQFAVGNVFVRVHRGRDQGRVVDPHSVVQLVLLLQPPQDGNSLQNGGLRNQDGLEPTGKGSVLLDVLAVLLQRCGPNTVQLPTRQAGLEHVGGINRALCRPGADQGVQLVNEQNGVVALHGIPDDTLETLFELPAELRPGHQPREVQREDLLVLDRVRYFSLDNLLRQSFHNSSLADAGFTDQHRVILGSSSKDLKAPLNGILTTNHWVQLAILSGSGEVPGVLLQELALGHGLRGDPGPTLLLRLLRLGLLQPQRGGCEASPGWAHKCVDGQAPCCCPHRRSRTKGTGPVVQSPDPGDGPSKGWANQLPA
eukprot:RCo007437